MTGPAVNPSGNSEATALHLVPPPALGVAGRELGWEELLEGYRRQAEHDGLRPSTIGMHVAHCRDLERRTDRAPGELTAGDLYVWLDRPTWAYPTRKAHRASAAAVLDWAAGAGLLEASPVEGVFASDLEDPPTIEIIAVSKISLAVTEHPARLWARRQGFPVAVTGRLPADLLNAWVAAGSPFPAVGGYSTAAVWARLLDDYETASRAAGQAATTIRTRRQCCEQLARATGLAPDELEPDDLIAWLGRENLKPATRHSRRNSLRSVLGWAYAAGRLPTDPAASLRPVRVSHGVPRPAPETTIRDAVNRASAKQRMILLLAAYEGLRRAEIARLRVEDLSPGGWHITGKGGRERLVPMHAALVEELRAYLEATGIRSGWLFPNPAGTGHLTIDHVGNTARRLLPTGVSLHKLRHRFASQAYASAYDIRSVQELLGHSSPAITAGYVAVPTPQLEATVLAVPPIPGITPAQASRQEAMATGLTSCGSPRAPSAVSPRPAGRGWASTVSDAHPGSQPHHPEKGAPPR